MAVSIVDEFVTRTTHAGFKLAQESDIMTLRRVAIAGAGLFAASFAIQYLARGPGREVRIAAGPIEVMIHFGPDYLRQVNPLEVAMVAQADFFHPNFRWPVLCRRDPAGHAPADAASSRVRNHHLSEFLDRRWPQSGSLPATAGRAVASGPPRARSTAHQAPARAGLRIEYPLLGVNRWLANDKP